MELGTYVTLKVLRESDISYLLTDGTNEVFLHKKEALKPYVKDDEVRVFLYSDNEGRMTASTKEAFVTKTTAAFLDVVASKATYGVFLHNNLVKDLLLSKDDLPSSLDMWPLVGSKLFVTLREKKQHLFAKQVGRKQIRSYFHEVPPLKEQDIVDAYIQFFNEEGLVAFTLLGQEIFVHKNNVRDLHHLGDLVHPKILSVSTEDAYLGTLIEQKEKMISSDAQAILSYLQDHGGKMRFTDNSSPEEIQSQFHMSKSAFKRALGSLYKSGLVELSQTQTKIK